MQSPEHLKRWLSASGRRFVTFKSDDLVDSLLFPEGHHYFQQLCILYGQYRNKKTAGEHKDDLSAAEIGDLVKFAAEQLIERLVIDRTRGKSPVKVDKKRAADQLKNALGSSAPSVDEHLGERMTTHEFEAFEQKVRKQVIPEVQSYLADVAAGLK